MNEKKIQTMLNVEILNRMNDQSAASVLKNILFNPDNHINWDEAYQLMMAFMPELNTIEGYKKENVTTYTDFITDLDKMRDFFDMSKEEFLLFYSYLEEIEYNLTAAKLKNMTTEEIVQLKSKCDELPMEGFNMKICNCCGATENQINISTYKAIGILNNKLETVKLDICDCCSSWSNMKDDERICKLTGFDYVLSDYMTEDVITQIADYMVKIGTENTSTGNYFFYFDELAEIFGVYEDDIIHCADLIIDELKKHEEFCWDDQTIEKDCFSIIFYTNYCPNIEE